MVGEKAIGHCTTHTVTMSSETKDRAVKPPSTKPKSAGLWKDKGVTGQSISISAEGLVFGEETENGFEQLAPLWGKGDAVTVKAFERENDTTPTIEGSFIITSLEMTAAAGDDATYSISLENNGEPTIYPGKS